MNEIINYESAKDMSKILANSSLLPMSLRKKPEDVFVLIQTGIELGLKPMQAINGINVIQGKPTISPQLMLALIYAKFPLAYIKIWQKDDGMCCEMRRSKDSESYISYWDAKRASAMGLLTKDNYKKQMDTMLKWRAVSDACRVVFPDVIQGLYTPEEISPDLVVNADGEAISVQPVENLNQPEEYASEEDHIKFKKLVYAMVNKNNDAYKSLLSAVDFNVESKYTSEQLKGMYLEAMQLRES